MRLINSEDLATKIWTAISEEVCDCGESIGTKAVRSCEYCSLNIIECILNKEIYKKIKDAI